MGALLAAGVFSSSSATGSHKNKDPHKCRGATALKVTEGNVRQELGFRPCITQPIQFFLG